VKNLTVLLTLALSCIAIAAGARAQDKDAKPADKPAEAAPAAPPKEESSVTDHSIQKSAPDIPTGDSRNHPPEKRKRRTHRPRYFTAYTRSDAKDLSQRPISFVYNGGPGSASVWLHMGSFSRAA